MSVRNAKPTVEQANRVMATFTHCRFIERDGRLWVVGSAASRRWRLGATLEVGGVVRFALRARVSRCSGALAGRYHHLGTGGTGALAIGQLILWLRGKPRLPVECWEYWVGPTLRLGREAGEWAPLLLRELGYVDARSTTCIKCGRALPREIDWWCVGNAAGPGCRRECKED